MPVYVLLSTLTDQGRKTVSARPERIKEVDQEIEAMGVKVLYQYVVMGPYDFVNIVEAKDNETVFKMSLALGSRGTVQIMSMAAMAVEDFIASIRGYSRESLH